MSAAGIGRISGPLLKENLTRNGVDLSFETDLLYLNVNDNRIGLKTDSPARDLEIVTHGQTTDLIVDNEIIVADVIVSNQSEFSSQLAPLYIDAGSTIAANALAVDKIKLDNNRIESTLANAHLELTASKQIVFNSNVYVDGSIHATGNVTFDGSIVFGSDDLDSVALNADVASNILPDQTLTYDLGSSSKQWQRLYSKTVNSAYIVANDILTPDNINFKLKYSNALFVSSNGSDINQGDHQNSPFATIAHALSVAESGDTVYIFPGSYTETFPLLIPSGVSVVGFDIRTTIIQPSLATQHNDAFLLNGETTISDLTIRNFYYDTVANTGHAFRLVDNFTVTSRSPYIQNITVITSKKEGTVTPGTITVGPAPTLFSSSSNSVTLDKEFYSQSLVDALVGQHAFIDRYPLQPLVYTVVSVETEPTNSALWRMTFDEPFDLSGQLKPISFYPDISITLILAPDIWATTGNSVGEKWVAFYKSSLPPFFNSTVGPGWTINVAGTLYIVDYIIEDPVNSNMWRIYVTTSLQAGVGIPVFSPPLLEEPLLAGRGVYLDGSVANSESKEASLLFHSCTFITPEVDCVTMTNGVRVEWLNSFTYFANRGLYATQGTLGFANQGSKFGAEIRSIGSANVYGNYGAVADGADTLMYLINHNFGYIGSGLDTSNDSTLVIQENEVIELNGGTIHYVSQSQDGNFRIGDSFLVNFDTGTVSFDTSGINANGISSILFQGVDSKTFITASSIETGNFKLSGNTIETLTQDFNVLSASNEINLTQDVNVSKNLNVLGNFQTEGTLSFGNQSSDTLTFNTSFGQDLIPNADSQYDLGSSSKIWKDVYLNRLKTDNVTVQSNEINATSADDDLILTGNGTGSVKIENIGFNNNTISSLVTNESIKITPNTGYSLILLGTSAAKIPRTTATLNTTGDLRFNSSAKYFEGFSTSLLTLGGAYSGDRNTSVLADPTNNVLNFKVQGQTTTTISNQGLVTNALYSQNLQINSNILTATSNSNISLVANSINLNDLNFETNDISSAGNIVFTPTGQGYIAFTGTGALLAPAGTVENRPATPVLGNTRYNTELQYMEVWDGNQWVSVSGSGDLASSEFMDDQTYIWSIIIG